MSIRKRKLKNGKLRYQADVKKKGFPRYTRCFEKKGDAAAWELKIKQEMKEGKLEASTLSRGKKLSEIIDKYLKNCNESMYKSEQYIEDVHCRLKYWRKRIGDFTLSNIRPRLLEAERDRMLKSQKFKSPATINRYMAALSGVFSKCVNEWQYLEYNPCKSIKNLREPTGRVRWLSDEERGRLLRAARMEKRKPMYTIIILAIATGARKSELLGIKKHNVLIEQKKIIIENTKNNENRSLYIDGHTLEIVEDELKISRGKKYLFSSIHSNIPITIEREWQRILRRSGVDNFRFHDLRHTAAAYLAMNNASLNEISELLGHKSYAMTKRYAHLADSHLKNVSNRVQRKIFNQKNVIGEIGNE